MTLHLYFARRFLRSFLIVFAAFSAMIILTESVEHVRVLSAYGATFSDALDLSLTRAPQNIHNMLPLMMIVAALSQFMSMARSSELVVTRASGRSALRSLIAPVGVSLFIGLAAVFVLNPIISTTSVQYEAQRSRLTTGAVRVLSISQGALWLRQGDDDTQTVIQAARTNIDGTVLFDVMFHEFDTDGHAVRRVASTFARLSEGKWILGPGKRWDLGPSSDNPEKTARAFENFEIPSELTRDQILESFSSPERVSIWDLRTFIHQLERSGFSAVQHRVHLHMELAKPLLLVSMVLIGAGFAMRHSRFGGAGIMVLLAVLSGFSVFFLNNFSRILGSNGEIPVIAAAWAPPLVGIFLALGLLLHLEDG